MEESPDGGRGLGRLYSGFWCIGKSLESAVAGLTAYGRQMVGVRSDSRTGIARFRPVPLRAFTGHRADAFVTRSAIHGTDTEGLVITAC
jgi:hypothetical protein